MRSRRLLIGCLVLASLAAGAVPVGGQPAATTLETSHDDPRIHAVYPDPVASGDRGEFVVLSVPDGTELGRYTVTDGDSAADLPNRTTDGRVAVTSDPATVRNLTDHPVIDIGTRLALANSGGTVSLRRNGTAVSRVRYSDTEEGDIGVVRGSTIHWRPSGATDRSVIPSQGGQGRAFALPDATGPPLAPIRNATERVYLAGYTLSSSRVADALIAASGRGANVSVLLDGDPVGGRTRAEAETLDRLTAAGIRVELITGPRARYLYHHAKYAVADDRAVVLTENWKPSGTGGQSSRGWGVITYRPAIVSGLVETFRADAGWRDTRAWAQYRSGRTFERAEPTDGEYPSRFDAARVPVDRTELLVTPDNAQSALVEDIEAADESVDVVQPAVGGWDEPLVRALRRAASRGVEVRLLLSSAWYVREENQRTVDRFQAWTDRTDAPLSARLADPDGRFAKIHAKGAIVDGDQVMLGSLNWNEQAATENREVILVLHGPEIADYFGRVFEADWTGGKPELPVGVIAAGGGVAILGALAARRLRFAS
jgi:phosphatidylserine/phosphatidylglycerophosphate/cardiolipin synthase-like enzyme